MFVDSLSGTSPPAPFSSFESVPGSFAEYNALLFCLTAFPVPREPSGASTEELRLASDMAFDVLKDVRKKSYGYNLATVVKTTIANSDILNERTESGFSSSEA